MKLSRTSLIQFSLIFFLLVALIAGLRLVRQPARPTPKASGPTTVQFYFSPSSPSIPPATQLDLMLDPLQQPVSFVRVEADFNPLYLQLVQEITTTPLLKYVIQKTPLSEANSSGHIIIVLGLDPQDRAVAPSIPFSLAQLIFQATTIQPLQTQITFPLAGPQIQVVDLSLNDLPYATSPATVNLNPTPTSTPIPTPTSTPSPTPTSTPIPTATPTLEPTPTPPRIPGDANGDGLVDGIDYTIWLQNYDQPTTLGYSAADFNGDNYVDGQDYTIWLLNYQV